MVWNAWHGPFLTSWLRSEDFTAKLWVRSAQKQSGGKQLRWQHAMLDGKKGSILKGKVVRRTVILRTVPSCLEIYCPVVFFSPLLSLAFPPSLLFFTSRFFFLQSFKITTALLMYLEDDYPLRLGFCSWTCPGEPHHPRCNRQEQKERRGKERRERQEFHRATTKNTVKSSKPPTRTTYPPSRRRRQPFNLLAVKIARSSSHPGRGIYWGILIIVCLQLSLIQTTRSLMRSFILSLSSFVTHLH